MKIRFPKIHQLLNSNAKLVDTDPRKSVHVFDGYAIVSNDIIAVVNLKEYVKRELNVSSQEEIAELNHLISWMNNKSFNKEFWAELTKEIYIVGVDPSIDELEFEFSGYNKKLQYLGNGVDNEMPLKLLKMNLNRPEVSRERIAISGEYLGLIVKAFSNEIKHDNLLFANAEQGTSIKFSLSKKDYIFGVVPENFVSSMDMMAFDNTNSMLNILENNGVQELDVEESEKLESLWNSDDDDDAFDDMMVSDEFETDDIKN